MVDFASQTKLYGYRYSYPEVRGSVHSARELNRQVEQLIYKSSRKQMHDCRPENIQRHFEPQEWEAHIMATGIKKTYEAINGLHHKEKEENEDGIKSPDKLLFTSGMKGAAEGQLNCPRGVATSESGDIIIADTFNHRIQIFNMCALIKGKFGSKGKAKGEFNQPTDVAVMANGRIVVADSKNKRIQIFSSEGEFKNMFQTFDEPCYITCDKNHNIVTSTTKRTVEVYRRQGALRYKFDLQNRKSPLCAPIVAKATKEEVIICDLTDGKIKCYDYTGKMLFVFEPQSISEGLASQPCSLALTPLGEILVADNLNHCVNLYSDTGLFISQIVNPSDSVGPVNACTVGPEGHMILTEFSLNGVHCIKIFRFAECQCHITRSGSSKHPIPPISPT